MKIQFLEFWGIDFNPVYDCYSFVLERPGTVFYQILGEFYWDNKMPLNGALIVSEEQLNIILDRCPITFRLIKEKVAYTVKKNTIEEIKLLNSLEYKVEMLEIIESEDDEDTIFGLITLKDPSSQFHR